MVECFDMASYAVLLHHAASPAAFVEPVALQGSQHLTDGSGELSESCWYAISLIFVCPASVWMQTCVECSVQGWLSKYSIGLLW